MADQTNAALLAEQVNVSEFEVPYATRLEVIGTFGRIITRRELEPGIRILVQDGARTVKVFIQGGEET